MAPSRSCPKPYCFWKKPAKQPCLANSQPLFCEYARVPHFRKTKPLFSVCIVPRKNLHHRESFHIPWCSRHFSPQKTPSSGKRRGFLVIFRCLPAAVLQISKQKPPHFCFLFCFWRR